MKDEELANSSNINTRRERFLLKKFRLGGIKAKRAVEEIFYANTWANIAINCNYSLEELSKLSGISPLPLYELLQKSDCFIELQQIWEELHLYGEKR